LPLRGMQDAGCAAERDWTLDKNRVSRIKNIVGMIYLTGMSFCIHYVIGKRHIEPTFICVAKDQSSPGNLALKQKTSLKILL
ncbi:MAG: hypothetical protein M1303_08650, partial [Bacteroidetes bacterium]|nr:hypothetical protein [Bacteroidota bacterium]